MQPHEVVVPVLFFSAVAGIWIVYLVARHKERVMLIEKGTGSEEIKSLYLRRIGRPNPLASLKWGLVFIGVGAAVLLGMWLRNTFMMDEGVFPALISLFGGLGLLFFYFIARKRTEE